MPSTSNPRPGRWLETRRSIKRLLDVTVAAVGLFTFTPLLIALSVAIMLDSPGSPIHRRRVVGLNGQQFDAFKLRTMVMDADEVLRRNAMLYEEFRRNFKLKSDPRITRIGRFLRRTSLDELPQLMNVLRGEMSIVGPRMISAAELEKYGANWRTLVSVKPGCTGPWVVAGRQQLDYSERVRLDLNYVERWSLKTDLAILMRTANAIVTMRGAV